MKKAIKSKNIKVVSRKVKESPRSLTMEIHLKLKSGKKAS